MPLPHLVSVVYALEKRVGAGPDVAGGETTASSNSIEVNRKVALIEISPN